LSHLDRVSVPQLVWWETTPHTSFCGRVMQLLARG
jgi:hypothetical protein